MNYSLWILSRPSCAGGSVVRLRVQMQYSLSRSVARTTAERLSWSEFMIKARRSDIIDTVTFERFCRTELGVKESWCATDVLHGVLRLIADEEDDGYGSSVFNPVDVEELLTLPLKMLQRYAHRAEPLLLPTGSDADRRSI